MAERLRRIGDIQPALPPQGQAAHVHWDLRGEAVAVVAPGLREVLAPHLLTALKIPETLDALMDTERGKSRVYPRAVALYSTPIDSQMNHDACFQRFHFGPVARTLDTEETYEEGRNQSAMFNSCLEINWLQ